MSRIPGAPEEKLALLSMLDYKALPHLTGDILYFLLNHREVKIVDGPGDGKRDVHSIRPDGSPHISQCKFHQDVNTTVGSSETDELVLALIKFGCKAGLFITTGRISPQAKREYLDNYPDFELDFWDGVNLVDLILSSPLLSTVWFDGTSIVKIRNALHIPFIIRRIKDDKPITSEEFTDIVNQEFTYKFDFGFNDKLDFEPYRPPLEKTFSEDGTNFIKGYEVSYSGEINIHDIPEKLTRISQLVAEQIDNKHLPAILRFGRPSLSSHTESAKEDKIKVSRVQPRSFVISVNREVITERDWVVIGEQGDWTFPENLSVAEADWAGWLSRSYNTIFMQELAWPTFSEEPYFFQQIRELRREFLEQSIFFSGSQTDSDTLTSNMTNQDRPDWYCSYGPNGVLMGWFHPALEAIENGHVVFQQDPQDDKYKGMPTVELDLDTYRNRVRKVRELFEGASFTEVKFEQARLISLAAGEDLLPETTLNDARSAQLFHDYEEFIPSPVYLGNRQFLFVRMWQVPGEPAEARILLKENPIDFEMDNVHVYWDARLGRKTEKTFVMSSLIFDPPPETSSNDYFRKLEHERDAYLEKLSQHIQSLWDDAKLATIFFWRTEVGFKIDEKGFRGNPWVMYLKSKESKE